MTAWLHPEDTAVNFYELNLESQMNLTDFLCLNNILKKQKKTTTCHFFKFFFFLQTRQNVQFQKQWPTLSWVSVKDTILINFTYFQISTDIRQRTFKLYFRSTGTQFSKYIFNSDCMFILFVGLLA